MDTYEKRHRRYLLVAVLLVTLASSPLDAAFERATCGTDKIAVATSARRHGRHPTLRHSKPGSRIGSSESFQLARSPGGGFDTTGSVQSVPGWLANAVTVRDRSEVRLSRFELRSDGYRCSKRPPVALGNQAPTPVGSQPVRESGPQRRTRAWHGGTQQPTRAVAELLQSNGVSGRVQRSSPRIRRGGEPNVHHPVTRQLRGRRPECNDWSSADA